MKYNPYIISSPKVSEIGLGAWQLGIESGWRGMSDNEAEEMVRYSIESGINFFDTAPNYGFGSSEERLGKALKRYDRSSIVVNTKFGHTVEGTTNFTAGYIRESIEGSLSRLQMDYVDSLIIHNPPFDTLDGRKNPHYEILEGLKEEGLIRAYGASLDTYKEMKLFMETTHCEVIEAFYNILHQDAARAFDLAKQKNVGIIVKIPLDSGWLTGKYNESSEFTGVRERWSKEDIATRSALVRKAHQIIGETRDLTMAALAFCLAHDAVSTIIPGNVSLEQLKNNLKSTEEILDREVIQGLKDFYNEEVSRLNLPW